jgi:ABC-type antimicrobial peptide transport system permease subunit
LVLFSQTAEGVVDDAYNDRIQLGHIFGVLAMIAVLIATVGLFALLEYRSLVRRPEFAIRSALGATPGRLFANVLSEAGGIWAIGCVTGVPIAYGISNALIAYFPKLDLPMASVTGGSIVAIGIVVLIAALLPARRAASVDIHERFLV